jgi:hypothetical protein
MRKIVLLAAVTAALQLAGPASATVYWSGWITRGTDDPNCVWYRGQAACTGWGYWAWNHIDRWDYYNGTLILGFENGDRIRGFENTMYWYDMSETIIPHWVNMGGYLIAHGTWWNGSGVQATLDARD